MLKKIAIANQKGGCGKTAPKGKNESKEEFEQRLYGETDHYINTHNFANTFII